MALGAAFEAELAKGLAGLPAAAACAPSQHDAHLQHYRATQRIAETVTYYASRLPYYASIHRILAFGDRLVKQNGKHRDGGPCAAGRSGRAAVCVGGALGLGAACLAREGL